MVCSVGFESFFVSVEGVSSPRARGKAHLLKIVAAIPTPATSLNKRGKFIVLVLRYKSFLAIANSSISKFLAKFITSFSL